MKRKKNLTSWKTIFIALAVTFFVANPLAHGQQEIILASLNDQHGAAYPRASLVLAGGNFYGTASQDGAYDFGGAVFELTPNGRGGWKELVLHNFQGNGRGGYTPFAGLVIDGSGNFYGTTIFGGNLTACPSGPGCGVVFELSPNTNGTWSEKVLHTFSGKDGSAPYGGVIFDNDGNLYGTTESAGPGGCGTVFELTPKTGGGWTFKNLHSFKNTDGCAPYGSLVFNSGNLYGTTSGGGKNTAGTVFELKSVAGGWQEILLHNFDNTSSDGYAPQAGLSFDGQGNLYGTTLYGGSNSNCNGSCGTVFELTSEAGGTWAESVIHNFSNNGIDGWWPNASLLLDSSGNLYGTTGYGGSGLGGYGTVFELSPSNGSWTEKILHNFDDNNQDGLIPNASLIFDGSGNLYSTTYGGGAGYGTVFEIIP